MTIQMWSVVTYDMEINYVSYLKCSHSASLKRANLSIAQDVRRRSLVLAFDAAVSVCS